MVNVDRHGKHEGHDYHRRKNEEERMNSEKKPENQIKIQW
jgi:hypothetical protein